MNQLNKIQNKLNEAVMNIASLQDELDALKSNLSEKPNSCYDHLLPEGYQFCTDEECDEETETMYLKVKLHNLDPNEKPLGSIMQEVKYMEAFYMPIRPIQFHIAVHEAVTTEPNSYTIEKHGDGWAIYQGRDSMHHGANLGQIHDGKLADILQRVLNIQQTNPYAVDWSNAPDWADVHCFDYDGKGGFYGTKRDDLEWFHCNQGRSGFTLPSGLDWTKSKTTRPCK